MAKHTVVPIQASDTGAACPDSWQPEFEKWRHGGWYVTNLRYPSGAIGCVSRNYPDHKWRIACDERRRNLNEEGDVTFPSRDAAARGEYLLVQEQAAQAARQAPLPRRARSG